MLCLKYFQGYKNIYVTKFNMILVYMYNIYICIGMMETVKDKILK